MSVASEKTSKVIKKKLSTKNLKFFIPRLTFKDTTMNIYLVYTLIIFAFLLGMLTNKVMYLEKIANAPVPTAAPAAGGQPAAPPAVVTGITNGHFPIQGDNNAKVTMIEFSDFQCPFCKAFFTDTEKELIDTYVKTGKIKFVYRQFPLTTIHPNAQKAAEAAECANEQGKFWEFHDIMFKNQDTWAPKTSDDAAADWLTYAGQIGLDTTQFQDCFTSGKYKTKVDDDVTAGTNAQVDGTPSFFINGVRVVGAVPFAQLKTTIDQELKK